MKIEWASSFRSDGSRRRPPPSTMHGWLAKMRGTLLGNEELRSKGMREMREAQAARKRTKGHHRASAGRSIFSIFSFYMGPSKKPVRARQLQGNPARPTNSSHPSHLSHRNHQSTSHPSHRNHPSSHRGHTRNVRPGTSRRSTGRTQRPSYSGSGKPRRSTR